MRRPPRIAVLAGLLGALAVWIVLDQEGAQPAKLSGPSARATPAAPQRTEAPPGLPGVPARAGLEALRADPFLANSWEPPVKFVAAPPAAPSAPPMPYRFAGRIYQDGALQVIFGKGDAVMLARQGDTLDGQYRVESVGDGELTLVYVPMGVKYKMQYSPGFQPERVETAVRGTSKPIGPTALQRPAEAPLTQTR